MGLKIPLPLPMQGFPPYLGSEQVLYLVLVPEPQVVEHIDHGPQLVQLPSMGQRSIEQVALSSKGGHLLPIELGC